MIVVMGALLLAMCIEFSRKSDGQKSTQPTWLVLCAILGLLSAIGILGKAGLSTLDQSVGKFGTPSFRMGRLIPWVSEDRAFRVNVTYVQASWFGFVTEGRWTARPTKDGGWSYLDQKKGWVNVPEEVWNPEALSDDREFATDNRGSYEQ